MVCDKKARFRSQRQCKADLGLELGGLHLRLHFCRRCMWQLMLLVKKYRNWRSSPLPGADRAHRAGGALRGRQLGDARRNYMACVLRLERVEELEPDVFVA